MGTVLISGALFLFACPPESSLADIYRWEDDSGVIHFTDTPSNIPEKYRNRRKMILQGPPESGHTSVSTMEAPPPGAPGPAAPDTAAPARSPRVRPPVSNEQAKPPENRSMEADQLRARIAAKEQFIKGVDLKRSRGLNPLGNRFVSPEDLELYKKYSDELPKDREQLKEIETAGP